MLLSLSLSRISCITYLNTVITHFSAFVKGYLKILGYCFYSERLNKHGCKIEDLICPYLRLTAETKFDVPDGTSLGFKPPALNSF